MNAITIELTELEAAALWRELFYTPSSKSRRARAALTRVREKIPCWRAGEAISSLRNEEARLLDKKLARFLTTTTSQI